MSSGFKSTLVIIAIVFGFLFYIMRAPTSEKITPEEEAAAKALIRKR
jgi:hypothetical protein